MADAFSKFLPFCRALRIASKDYGLVPLRLNGCQREFVRRVRVAIAKGRRRIVILKGRQQGISTVCLALDLFWTAKFPGLQGGVITDSDEARTFFRSTLTEYHEKLPAAWKVSVKRHNREHLLLGNGSMLNYMVAGRRKNSNLAQSKALNFAHFTEVSSYGDQEGLDRATGAVLSDLHPYRLYLFESTAKGFDLFNEMWETAKRAATQEAIFIPWWLKEEYVALGPVMAVYGGMELDSEERKWVAEVEKLYGYRMREEQLAWFRWKLAEEYKGSLTLAYQEYPPTEDMAFQMTGSAFFSGERLTLHRKRLVGSRFRSYRYKFGMDPMEVELHECEPELGELRVWRNPVPGAHYALGADPAYGSSEWADSFAIQVLRCWGDKCEQVAEFATTSLNTSQFAWVICHLAGYYGATKVNIELTGPGDSVFQEMRNIERRRGEFANVQTATGSRLSDVLGTISYYLWRRLDSMGAGFAYQFKTSQQSKSRMMFGLQSSFELERIILHSAELLREMRGVTNIAGSIEAAGRAKDDRVIALGLAHIVWVDWLRNDLAQRRILYTPAEPEPENEQIIADPSKLDIAKFLPPRLQRAR
jgi:hypothetical protein